MRKTAGITTACSIILGILNNVVRKENESGKLSVIKNEMKLLLFVTCKFF